MAKVFFELILAFLVTFLPISNNVSEETVAEPVSVTAEVTSMQEDGVKIARFQNVLNHNHCFGSSFENDELLASASLSLSYLIEDGYIEKSAVDNFVFNMYGVDTSSLPCGDKEGCYNVEAMGFASYTHTVENFSYNGDGTITVTSKMSVDGEGEYDCTSVFFANGESIFGYNLISCVVNW